MTPRIKLRWVAVVAGAIFLLAHLPSIAWFLDDIDAINFAMGLREYDIAKLMASMLSRNQAIDGKCASRKMAPATTATHRSLMRDVIGGSGQMARRRIGSFRLPRR